MRLVLDWRVQEHYPELVEMICMARNLPGEINRRTSVFEVCQQIFNLSQNTKDAEGYPDWAEVQRKVARSRATCFGMLQELIEFVIACSGGSSGVYLREQLDLWRNCQLGGLNRTIPSKVYRALAASGHPGGDPMARFKNMFILTTLTAEPETIEDGICTFISATDCDIFSAKKESTLARVIT